MKRLMSFVFIVLLLIIAGGLVAGKFMNGFSFSTVSLNEKQEFEGKGVSHITIDSPKTDIVLKVRNQDEVTIEMTGVVSKRYKDHYEIQVTEGEEEMKIGTDDNQTFSSWPIDMLWGRKEAVLEVTIPKRVYDQLMITTVSGDVTITELESKMIEITSISGDLSIDNVKIMDSLLSKTTSGDINVNQLETNGGLLKSTSGDIKARELHAKKWEFESTSGDILLEEMYGEGLADTVSGDIRLKQETIDQNITVESTSGDVKMEISDTPKSLEIDFDSTSGDGTVEMEGISFSEKSESRIVGKIGNGEVLLKVRTTSGDFDIRE
ncbi:DUF4097 family beta strand repeat-containing protein [Peribacillus acanthi]|uniref:DUF4097 family beta strand repeat-containing protein n=1 Tax=Peribacillus acanthi TaxID=2171554 RepID=UPI000D3E2FCC|nr:DUF4097 family beta strand repeat-containing protein [Peribacillus acanthi]